MGLECEAVEMVAAQPSRSRVATTKVDARLEARMRVSALASVVTGRGKVGVRVIGLGAKTAALVADADIGGVGACLDLLLPVVGGRELPVPAGISAVEIVDDDELITVEFMIAEVRIRRELNELLALLLAGQADAGALQPRVIYDTFAAYGRAGQRRGRLEELSLTGLVIRMPERVPYGMPLRVEVPSYRTTSVLPIEGRVQGQQLSPDGGYRTALSFGEMTTPTRRALAELLADLMCR